MIFWYITLKVRLAIYPKFAKCHSWTKVKTPRMRFSTGGNKRTSFLRLWGMVRGREPSLGLVKITLFATIGSSWNPPRWRRAKSKKQSHQPTSQPAIQPSSQAAGQSNQIKPNLIRLRGLFACSCPLIVVAVGLNLTWLGW